MENEEFYLIPRGSPYQLRLVTDESQGLGSSEPFVSEEERENDEGLEPESHNDDAGDSLSHGWSNQRELTHYHLVGRPGVFQKLRTTRHSWDKHSAFKNPHTVPWEIPLSPEHLA